MRVPFRPFWFVVQARHEQDYIRLCNIKFCYGSGVPRSTAHASLPSLRQVSGDDSAGSPPDMTIGDMGIGDMAIDELARRAGTTTRNIRALQSLGLLLPPTIRGRTAHYDEAHLGRLEAVIRLQRSGFSLASIRALLEALSRGQTLADVLGLRPETPGGESERRAQAEKGAVPATAGRSASPVRPLRLLSILPSTVLD